LEESSTDELLFLFILENRDTTCALSIFSKSDNFFCYDEFLLPFYSLIRLNITETIQNYYVVHQITCENNLYQTTVYETMHGGSIGLASNPLSCSICCQDNFSNSSQFCWYLNILPQRILQNKYLKAKIADP